MVATTQEIFSSNVPIKNGKKIFSKCNPICNIFFCSMAPLLWLGRKRELTSQDLDEIENSDLSQKLGDQLEQNWFKELSRAKAANKTPNFGRAIFKTFIRGYLIDGLFLFIQGMICKPFQPVLLALLISQFGNGSEFSYYFASIYASGLIGLSLLAVIIQHNIIFRTCQRGMRIRIACCSLLYRKTLRLSTTSLSQTTAGQLVNLMSNDVNRFDNVLSFLHFLWIMPFQIVFMCFILYLEVNVAAIVGVICVTLQTVPVQSYLSKLSSKLRLKIAKRTDERVRLMNEIISGIQVIKMYAWEKPFEKLVSLARDTELAQIINASYIRAVFMGSMVFTERASLYVTLLTYSLLGYPISAAAVFSLAQFYNKIQESLAFQYPNAMSLGAECLATIKRIQDYLMLDERDIKPELLEIAELKINNLDIENSEKTVYGTILMDQVSASWNEEQPTLKNINLNIEKGKLYAIIGSVGAGKSSLLQLILKELPIKEGTMKVNGDISYASQNSWLFVDTIRNNILFGEDYDKHRYKSVISACGLEPDFKQFPRGDKTLVGERGISLSGGQRARINLARAVYRQADIYLLDDPLSAVDTHVGRHLFEKCIESFLENTTRILVTHQVHYLKTADLIIIIQDGKIDGIGSYDELVSSRNSFNNFLSELQESKQDGEDNYAKKFKKQTSTISATIALNESLIDNNFETESEVVEESESGKIKMKVYWQYWKSGKNNALVFLMMFVMFIGQLTATASDYWVTYWSNQQNGSETINSIEQFNHNSSRIIDIHDKIGNFTTLEYLYIYSGLIVLCVIFIMIRSVLFFLACMKSSKGLHDDMFHKLLRVKMRFFDENPSGRILNRFSKDMGAADELLPRAGIDTIQIFLVFCSIMSLVAFTNPWLTLPIFIIIIFFHQMFNFYLHSAQSIKRLESTSRSPVFSHVSATLNGIITIRAFKSQKQVIKEFDSRQDIHTITWNHYLACGCTLGFWLDIMCVVFLTVVTFTFIYFNDGTTSSGDVGLAVSQSLILMGMLQFGIRQATEVVAQMTSVERIIQYTELKEEDGLERGVVDTPSNWPSGGAIRFKNTYLNYKENDPPVLKNLNFAIKSGWKIGIVGRTGAGKSSLISALFRLNEIRGQILIDDVDVKDIALQDTRSSISIIPQEPVLFSASLRYNLDPFNKFSDADLWNAIEAVELKDGMLNLDYAISEGGGNLSLGQRQLICLARAIIRKNKIIVLDEATANVDLQTDSLIQTTIRTKFPHCTVLTIAHRLNTIMDSDRVLVLNNGEIMEFDHPYHLLQNSNGYFSKMVQETGNKMEQKLIDMAKNAYLNSVDKNSQI